VGGLCEHLIGIATQGAINESTLPQGKLNLIAFNKVASSSESGRRTVRVG
jgi:hypothetical protein